MVSPASGYSPDSCSGPRAGGTRPACEENRAATERPYPGRAAGLQLRMPSRDRRWSWWSAPAALAVPAAVYFVVPWLPLLPWAGPGGADHWRAFGRLSRYLAAVYLFVLFLYFAR